MNQPTETSGIFMISFRDQEYPCKVIERNGSTLYFVKFNNSLLCLTKALDFHGQVFWASIPEDYKLRPVLQEIGEQIQRQLK